MTIEDDLIKIFDDVIERYTKQMDTVAHEDNSQAHDDPSNLLNDGIKKHFDMALSILIKLYGEFIKKDDATVQDALELIPLFGVYGMWIGAQLGVSQQTYNVIVDYYLQRLDLVEKR